MPIQLVHPTTNKPIAASSAPGAASEGNHRIANSLALIASLVRLQASEIGQGARTIPAGEVRLILEGLGSRINTVARLHHLLTDGDQNAPVDLARYLRDVSEAAVSALSLAGQMELRFALEAGCAMPAPMARSVGLIVAELMINSVRYAHPSGVAGKIRVGCRTTPDGLAVVEVSDDGVGLPEGFDPATDGHLGLRLVRSFADQLAATCDFNSSPLGLSVTLRIPADLSA